MKTILVIIVLVAFMFNANSQISLEQSYHVKPLFGHSLSIVHFSHAGYKYALVDPDSSNIKLYNLDHSLFKTIIVPPQPLPQFGFLVFYLSDELFNTNPDDVEYILENRNSAGNEQITVYDETGNVLFNKVNINFQLGFELNIYAGPIKYTSSGAKMVLTCGYDSTVYVYSLPGILPCNDCSNGIVDGMKLPGGKYENNAGISNSYPNPSINSTRIDYTLPNGTNQGEIVFYNIQGNEVKRFKVDNTFNSLQITTSDLNAGTYYYQLQTSGQITRGKKMVVIK